MEFLKRQYQNIADKSSPYMILPPFGFATLLICYDLYSMRFIFTRQKKKPTAYSKFTIPERLQKTHIASGATLQTIAYGIPFTVVLSYLLYQFKSQTTYKDILQFCGINIMHNKLQIESNQFRYKLPFILILTHFIKRMFEANFIHIISNKGPVFGGMAVGIYYIFMNMIPLYFQQKYVNKQYYSNCNKSLKIGLFLYFIGEFGNFYHHYILRRLRLNKKPENKNKYILPTGGLFEYVWCPHYLFELMAWFGIATTSKHLFFFMTASQMTSYLTGRAVATQDWYHKRFQGESRNAIIPFIL